MKISKSKQQLAKIISENGGWREGALWSAQDSKKDDFPNRVCFYQNPPRIKPGDTRWLDGGLLPVVGAGITATYQTHNWHQTILSRDEYFHLYPAPDADGWIEWKGDEGDGRPVDGSVIVDVEYYDKIKHFGHIACNVNWSLAISYRLHKPEHAEQEYPDGVKPTDPAKKEPTIEQLAADYRAKLAIAQQAQEEADSHRCGAEAALEKLVAAGKALGLALSVAAPEPELVITDWRDLQIGDIIECIGSWENEDTDGHQFAVTKLDHPHSQSLRPIRISVPGVSCPGTWGLDFKFIRRPAKGGADA